MKNAAQILQRPEIHRGANKIRYMFTLFSFGHPPITPQNTQLLLIKFLLSTMCQFKYGNAAFLAITIHAGNVDHRSTRHVPFDWAEYSSSV